MGFKAMPRHTLWGNKVWLAPLSMRNLATAFFPLGPVTVPLTNVSPMWPVSLGRGLRHRADGFNPSLYPDRSDHARHIKKGAPKSGSALSGPGLDLVSLEENLQCELDLARILEGEARGPNLAEVRVEIVG